MPATARRLAIFQESVIREMTRLANQHGSINLAQGFPGFRSARRVDRCAGAKRARAVSPILDHVGRGAISPGTRRQDRPLWRAATRSRPSSRGHLRQHGGHDGGDDDRLRSRATKLSSSRPSTRTTRRMRSSPERSRSMSRCVRLTSPSIATSCAAPSRRSPRRWCFAIRPIRAARFSRATSCSSSSSWRGSTTPSSSPTRSTSTSFTRRTGTSPSPRCPERRSAR